MPDVYANITAADPQTQERLVAALELRAAERRQREILETYLAWLDLPRNAHLLEVGCGSGAITQFWRSSRASRRSWASILRRYSSPRRANWRPSTVT